MANNKTRSWYRYEVKFGQQQHMWCVVTARGGVHVWASQYKPSKDAPPEYTGGIEVHYRTPPSYMADQPPSHDECFLLKAPCWHDGSSLQFEERWLPMFNPERPIDLLYHVELEALSALENSHG